MAGINEVNTGIKFYGMNAVDYSLSSEPGKVMDFETLLRKIAIDRSVKLQAEVAQLSAAVKTRQKIVDTLGKAMAFIDFVATDLNKEKYGAKRWYEYSTGDSHFEDMKALWQIQQHTGVGMRFSGFEHIVNSDGTEVIKIQISKEDALKDQISVQYQLDMQNNLLQQEMVAVQSLFNKQSDAFTTAKKLTTKVSGTRKNTIQGMS